MQYNEDTISLTSHYWNFIINYVQVQFVCYEWYPRNFKTLHRYYAALVYFLFLLIFILFSLSILGFSGIQRWGVRALELYRQEHFWLDKSPDAAPPSGQWGSHLSACTNVPTPQQVLQTVHGHWWYKHYTWRVPSLW